MIYLSVIILTLIQYNLNINCNIEVSLFKFLNTKIHCDNNEIKCFAYHKDMKLPFHWKDIVPEYYKINVFIRHLHQVKILGENFEHEVRITRGKYIQLSKLGEPRQIAVVNFCGLANLSKYMC